MTDRWIKPTQTFDGQNLHQNLGVRIADDHIAAVGPIPNDARPETVEGILTPGFVDLQVNGGGGVLLNQTPTADGQRAIASAHHSLGTVAIMPTVITDTPKVLERVVQSALDAQGDRRIVGLHIEGPHIAPAKRGTHASTHIRPLDDHTMQLVQTLRARDIAVMLTLAPEAATPAQIKALSQSGVIVSLGHTDATADQTRVALAAGARCFTHLFNAMSPMHSRAPGVVGAAINSDAYAGFICDGIHVADEMLALAIRARPALGRMFLVSDAMPTVGGPSEFTLYDQTIRLKDGRLINDDGALAGAHTTMAEGVARLVNSVGVDVQTALQMAITVPAQMVNQPHLATLVGRRREDIMLLKPNMQFSAYI